MKNKQNYENKSKEAGKEVKYERTYVMSCQVSILVMYFQRLEFTA